jgi:ATP-binding cassette subfamily B protein RaxB
VPRIVYMQEIHSILDFGFRRKVKTIYQSEIGECGLASLAMIANYHGLETDLRSLRSQFRAGLTGMNLHHIVDLSRQLGFSSRAMQVPIESLSDIKLPCILHWDMSHFVILSEIKTGIRGTKYVIHDPAIGKQLLGFDELSRHFTGICLELTVTSKFNKTSNTTKLKVKQLYEGLAGFKYRLAEVLGLSFILQLLVLATPLYIQTVIDDVLVTYDENLLFILLLGFSFILVLTGFSEYLRNWLVLKLSTAVNFQLGINTLHHMLKLPTRYFEERKIGDIISRFGSLAKVRERITSGLIEAIIDGVMAVMILVLMFIYSVELTALVLFFVSLYLVVRISMYPNFKQASEDAILASSTEQTNFIENVRAIKTIKVCGKEAQRESAWQNLYIGVLNSEIKVGRLKISFENFRKLIFGFEKIFVIYIAALFVMDGKMSVGMVLAFIFYKEQLVEKGANLVEQYILFKILRLHLDRISDIVLEKPEAIENTNLLSPDVVIGGIRLENINFSYLKEKRSLSDINLNIAAGNTIAIVGPSGCGKTTLVKVLLGLIKPDSGRIFVDSTDVTSMGLRACSDSVSAVMQSDTLFSGSISDNISFFDPYPDSEKINESTKLASIDSDIENMVMGYNTIIGDMGTTLSGGQVQRILLARAFYRNPKILVLDEATSHLDMLNEKAIVEGLDASNITKIVIAHRKETIESADVIVKMKDGRVESVLENSRLNCSKAS